MSKIIQTKGKRTYCRVCQDWFNSKGDEESIKKRGKCTSCRKEGKSKKMIRSVNLISFKSFVEENHYYRICSRVGDGWCTGYIKKESVVGGLWSLPLCEKHIEDKEKNVQIVLNRGSEKKLRSISGEIDYVALRDRLNKRYGYNS